MNRTEKALKEKILAAALGTIAAVLLITSDLPAETLKESIRQALEQSDTTLAISLLEREIKVDQSYHYNHYVLGQICFQRGEYTRARDLFATAFGKKKKHWPSRLGLIHAHLKLGELDEAEKLAKEGLKKAKKDNKDQFEYSFGLIKMERGEYNDADVAFRRAIALDSTNAEYHIGLGDANFYQGVPALAIIEYETALQMDTASTEVYFHWAEACLEMKDYTCAIDKLKIVLSKDSTHAPAWNRAGGIYFKAARSSRNFQERKARFRDAIGCYQRYLELAQVEPDSAHVRPFFETAMAYVNILRFEDAVPFFEQVLSIPIEPRDIYFYFGKSLWGVKDFHRATEVLLKHIDWVSQQGEDYHSSINPAELHKLLGDAYFYRKPKEYSLAVKHYKLSLENDPDKKRLVQNIAFAFHQMSRYGEALPYYDQRISLGIDSGSANFFRHAGLCALNIAGQLEEEGEDEMAGEDEDAPVGVDPDRNYYQAATEYFEKYLEFNPADTVVLLRVANTYLYKLQDCTSGVKSFDRLLSYTPNNCEAKKSLGFAYFGGACTTNYSKALRYLRQAQNCVSKKEGACADVALVKYVAQAYHLRATSPGAADSNGDYKNAFEWYSRVLKCDPGDEEAKKGQDDTRFEFN